MNSGEDSGSDPSFGIDISPTGEPAALNTEYLAPRISGRKIRKGLLIFIFLTIAALTILFIRTHSEGAIEAFRNYDTEFLFLTVVLLIFDILLGAFRNHVFMKKLDPGVEFMTSLRANLANTFAGAITPSQGGGGPAQFYVYHRKGASIGQAIFVAAFNYLSTLIVFISGAALALFLLNGAYGSRYTGIIMLCFVIFFIEFVLLAFALARPELFTLVLGRFTDWFSGRFSRIGSRLRRITSRVTLEVDSFRDSSKLFFGSCKMMIPLSLVLTLILYLNKYVIAYLVVRGLGISCDFMTVITIQAVLMCIIYFSPSPGGSGIAELSIAALMSTVVPESMLGVYSLLQRFFLLYVPVTLGSIVIFYELRVASRHRNTLQSCTGSWEMICKKSTVKT
jgi:uncharacterized protein (TIRG00374 family)